MGASSIRKMGSDTALNADLIVVSASAMIEVEGVGALDCELQLSTTQIPDPGSEYVLARMDARRIVCRRKGSAPIADRIIALVNAVELRGSAMAETRSRSMRANLDSMARLTCENWKDHTRKPWTRK